MRKALAIKKFEEIRDIPYRIPLTAEERDDCCIGKHIKLREMLMGLGYECRYRMCAFKWSDFDCPKEILDLPHDNDCNHLYLEVKIHNKWKTLDATWDKGLANILPINDWDGKSHKKIVLDEEQICSVRKSQRIMAMIYDDDVVENDLERNGQFYKALNDWLASERNKSLPLCQN